jgi:hypothetical protein
LDFGTLMAPNERSLAMISVENSMITKWLSPLPCSQPNVYRVDHHRVRLADERLPFESRKRKPGTRSAMEEQSKESLYLKVCRERWTLRMSVGAIYLMNDEESACRLSGII